ncbi:hypothetical protein AT15_00015 [Kosmotoga arenicorallina S304]|uniref:Uncharacterized protein n=1 Tax=Kosmotoga arenicorallina S304 TaxID=1453497 RepID=A0A182C848_9BACT|nr:hypothetical protein [Kosmotoga arenicorallina]OAA32498.1 hypothetical protein AT15_00015 [Kosmotoga arenicorallina S304]
MVIVFSCPLSIVTFFPNTMRLITEIDNTGFDFEKDEIRFSFPNTIEGFEIYIQLDETSRSDKEINNLYSSIHKFLNDLFEFVPNKKFQIKRMGNDWISLC